MRTTVELMRLPFGTVAPGDVAAQLVGKPVRNQLPGGGGEVIGTVMKAWYETEDDAQVVKAELELPDDSPFARVMMDRPDVSLKGRPPWL